MTETSKTTGSKSSPQRGWRAVAAVLLGALFISWTAIYNRFPLLYPDSMTYLDDGRTVARAVFLHRFAGYYGMRSFIYSLGILPFHWNISAWPVVALQSILIAYVLWLVVRSFAVGPAMATSAVAWYLALILLLSALTSLSWYATLVLPDILGPALYLSIYLLVFARETLTRAERLSLYPIAWWGVASHASHLMLAAGLCVLLVVVAASSRTMRRQRLWRVGEVAIIVALAAGAQLALNGYLYGEPSLNGERPPFLMARVIADGPGRWYLDRHCGELKWVICDHVHNLSSDPDTFLWGSDGVWQNLSDEDSQRLGREEMPFVLATLREYPRQQMGRSLANFWGQLTTFGLDDLDPSSWVLDQFDTTMPRAKASYLKSRQAQDAMPLDLFSTIHYVTVIASLGVIAVLTPFLWLRRRFRASGLGWLTLIVAFVMIANAFVTGTLSMVESRLQSRVVWMIPLLAGLFVLEAWGEWRGRRRRGLELASS